MAFNRAAVDRVMESSITTGTGTYTLAGAVTGYQAFSDAIRTGSQCYYCAYDVDVNGVASGDWEVGLGTYTLSGTTLARTRVDESSNGDAAVNWAAGTRRIFITRAAHGVPVNGWTNRNAIVYNSYTAPDYVTARVKDAATVNWRLLMQSLGGASTYTLTATVACGLAAANSGAFGVYVSDGTKLIGFEHLGQTEANGGLYRLRVQRMNSVTSDDSTVAGPTVDIATHVLTVKIVKDSSNRTFYYHAGGAFVQFYQEGNNDFLTETEVGFGGLSVYGGRNDSVILVQLTDFRLTTP